MLTAGELVDGNEARALLTFVFSTPDSNIGTNAG